MTTMMMMMIMMMITVRDCAIIIRRGALKPEGGGALHKIAAKIGGLKVKSLI